MLNDLLKKQSNRILNINGNKESGALVDTAIGLGNDAYVLAGGEKDRDEPCSRGTGKPSDRRRNDEKRILPFLAAACRRKCRCQAG